MEYIKNSIAYKNSNQSKKNNLYNTFSQIYSRNKVKDLFEKYSTDYDFVISTCFDGFELVLNFLKNTIFHIYNKIKYTHRLYINLVI